MSKSIILIFLFFISVKTYSQNCDVRNKQLDLLFDNFSADSNAKDLLILATNNLKLCSLNDYSDSNYATALCNLGWAYFLNNENKKADSITSNTLLLREKNLGINHLDYSISLNNLAVINATEMKRELADSLFAIAKQLHIDNNRTKHDEYFILINNLSSYYYRLDSFGKGIYELRNLFDKSPNDSFTISKYYLRTIMNLAKGYRRMDSIDLAEHYYLTSLELCLKSNPIKFKKYELAIYSLAMLYLQHEKNGKALSLFIKEDSLATVLTLNKSRERKNIILMHANFLAKEKKYFDAIILYNKTIDLYNINNIIDTPLRIITLIAIGNCYFNLNELTNSKKYTFEAEKLLKSCKKMKYDRFGKLITTIQNRYHALNDTKSEIDFLTWVSNNFIALYPKEFDDYIDFELKRSNLLFKVKDFVLSDSILENLIDNFLIVDNKLQVKILDVLNRYWENKQKLFGLNYVNIKQKNILKLIQDKFTKYSKEYASILFNIGKFYYKLGGGNDSEKFHREALTLRKEILGESNLEYANSLLELGKIEVWKVNYTTAEENFIKAKNIYSDKYGLKSKEYTLVVLELANLYFAKEDYKQAEELLTLLLNQTKKNFGSQSLEYAKATKQIAEFFYVIGDYTNARKHIEISKNIYEALDEDSKFELAVILSEAADYYDISGMKKTAYKYLRKAISIFEVENEDPNTHTDYLFALEKLGDLYYYSNDLDSAKIYYTQAIKMSNNFGFKVIDYSGLAKINYLNKDYKTAEYYANLTLSNFPEHTISIALLSKIYKYTGRLNKADSMLIIQFKNETNDFRKYGTFLSSKQFKLWLKSAMTPSKYYSFISSYTKTTLSDSLINFTYFVKGALLQSNNRLTNAIKNTSDTLVKNNYQTFKDLKNQINKQSQLPKEKQVYLQANITEAEKIEKQLMQQVPEFQAQTLNNNIKWQQIQAKLKDNEAAIEFVHFNYYNKRWTDTTYYAAYIIKKGITRPFFITCFKEADLTAMLAAPDNPTAINKMYGDPQLYNLIWLPIDSTLKNINTVSISPSGLLHRVAMGAIVCPNGNKLLQNYQIRLMGNTRTLAEKEVAKVKLTSAVVLGGIDYNASSSNTASYITSNTNNQVDSALLVSIRGNTTNKWQYLIGTKKEADSISTTFTNNNLAIHTYIGSAANEETIKAIGTGKQSTPSVLHIATHGFAIAPKKAKPKDDNLLNTKEPKYNFTEDPLSRAGLVLAGANQVWTSGVVEEGKEDGILTASEIAELDLSKCQLAVLSACETGLGDLQNTEGVYGLQRAFKLAGVQNIISSLWQVSDEATREFMQTLYTNWLNQKMELNQAFTFTQQSMSKKYEVSKWAGFVLME
jgi:CHAT domain-containing protein/tetratricopeptide (TPR) repeat protein